MIANEPLIRKKMQSRIQAMDWIEMKPEWFQNKGVLDIGPAYGIWSIKAAQEGGTVLAIDVREKWRPIFKANCSIAGVEEIPYVIGDIADPLPYPSDYFQTVMLMAVLHHVKNWQATLDNVFRVASERILFEVAIKTETPVTRAFTKRRKPWAWVPTEQELFREIEDRGGKLIKESICYGRRSGCDRIFMCVEVQS